MVDCNVIYNESCLKCDRVEEEMIRIGERFTVTCLILRRIVMCRPCWEQEFGTDRFPETSIQYENFINWVQKQESRNG
jgi:hypothetical protein